jgi:uncharacterized membrane protein (DUF4010 family)
LLQGGLALLGSVLEASGLGIAVAVLLAAVPCCRICRRALEWESWWR